MLTEQYVCQQLLAECGLTSYYWSAENARGEMDFLVQPKGAIYPIEVKAEKNLRSKSLAAFNAKYEDMSPREFSLLGFRDQVWMRNVPLYAIGNPENLMPDTTPSADGIPWAFRGHDSWIRQRKSDMWRQHDERWFTMSRINHHENRRVGMIWGYSFLQPFFVRPDSKLFDWESIPESVDALGDCGSGAHRVFLCPDS